MQLARQISALKWSATADSIFSIYKRRLKTILSDISDEISSADLYYELKYEQSIE